MNSIFIDKNLFAINMKNFRENFNLSQSAAAKELDIPRTSLMNYEKGKYFPEITTLLNICSLYKCSLSELLSIDDSSFMNIPEFFNRIDDDKIMINKFKEQLSMLTELNLKNIKLNNEIKTEKNKLLIKTKKLDTSKKYYDKSILELNNSKKRYDKSLEELNNSKKRYDKSLEELNNSKKRYDKSLEELNSLKKRYDKSLEELNNSQKRCERLINELNESKKNYAKLINNLTFVQDTYLKSSSDIDDTRTYFLNSFSNVLENANNLLNKIENDCNLNDSKNNINVPTVLESTKKEITDTLTSKINSNNIDTVHNHNDEEDYVNVHFLNTNIAAGEPISYFDIDKESFLKLKTKYPLTKENANEFYILTVKGNSMNKIVPSGEHVLIRSTNYVENGTIAAINILDERECTLKYYYYNPINKIITLKPKSYDPNYKDLIFDVNKCNVLVQGEYVGKVSDYL